MIENLKNKIKTELLIDKTEVADVINESISNNSEFFVLTKTIKQKRLDSVMPTLCAIKKCHEKFFFLNSLEELIQKISNDDQFKIPNKNATKGLYDVLNCNFSQKTILPRSEVEVYSNDLLLIEEFDLLDQAFELLMNNCANMLNLSMDDSLAKSMAIGERYSKRSIRETASSIAEFISSEYKMRCEVFNIIQSNHTVNDINGEDLEALKSFGRPLYSFAKGRGAILYFPFTNDRKSIKLEYIFKISSKNSISKDIIGVLTKSFNYYFNSYIPNLIINHISQLQSDIIAIHNDNRTYINEINFEERLGEFSKTAFEKLILNCGAHSATLRLHNPFPGKLQLITEVLSEGASNESRYQLRDILVTDISSVNGLTFRSCNANTFIYIKDIKGYKRKFKRQTPIDRDYSKSELCFPFYFKNIIVGTINFESPSTEGFGLKLKAASEKNNIDDYKDDAVFNFFYTIKKLIEEYAEVLYDSNDRLWLAKRVQIYQAIHELRVLVNNKAVRKSHQVLINNVVNPPQDFAGDYLNVINLFESIRDFRQTFIDNIKKETTEGAKEFESALHIENPFNSEVLISEEKYSFIRILFVNIFSNFYKHYDQFENESIAIRLVKDILFVYISFDFKSYSKENRHRYLVRPYSDTENGSMKLHYGLFLIGMIARHLKGTYYFEPAMITGKKKATKILIKIPFNH